MLTTLRIRDLVLIENLDVALSPGFNVLTGETGAGKSLIATAIDLLLGQRASGELVRLGQKEAEVEGLFDVSDEPGIRERLDQAGLPVDDELLVRRVITAGGRHRCYVNGRLASLGVLSGLTEGLANVMSQHEHHALLDPGRQLKLLDGFGALGDKVEKMAVAHAAWRERVDRLEGLKEQERDRVQRLDYLQFQLGEIEKIAPQPDELDRAERDIERMRHARTLIEASTRGAEILYDAQGSVFEKLGLVERELSQAARVDPALDESVRQVTEAAAIVEDTARFLSGYGPQIEADPDQLAQLEERRDDLKRLMRKHDTDLDGVLEVQQSLQAEVETLSQYEQAVDDLEAAVVEQRELAERCAATLTKGRRKAARSLAKLVSAELSDLEFGRAEFSVDLNTDPASLGPQGADRAAFVIALNPGEGAHQLRKVASGGELSRLMLAIKRALAGVGPHSTYVFDEVDAGISGPVAASVGRKLKEVAAHHQVICITHLPQISGMADAHFYVSKKARKGRTSTVVQRLEDQERIREVARMLGGEKVTKRTLDAAKELIASPAARR